jgi:2-polyprenyl-6-methoxyphenol hydroxylase-like FAD-dependent oxidoreductase
MKEATLMSNQSDVPVVIVGAGPTGVLLAIELARRGVEVRVLDKQPSRSQETRAVGIHARTLEVFHQLGIVEEFLALGHRVTGFVVHTRARRNIELRFAGIDSPYPFLLTLGQHETQRILDQRLERLGVTIDRGVNVVDLRQDSDGVELQISLPREQRERTLLADWAIGCDGAHSIVRRRLGVPFDGDDYGQDWLMAEVKIDWPLRSDRFHVFAYTAASLPMFPLPSDRWRVFMPEVPNRSVGERQPPNMEEVERLVAGRGPAGMKLSDPTLLAAFRCYRRSTKTMRSGRVLVVGDAAHIHSPAGGQGMNTGLHDAFNLGWKLALVAHRQAPPALLDTYQAERAPIATGVLALTHALVRTFAMASPRKRWMRDRVLHPLLALPTAERRYMTRLAQISHNYRGGPLAPVAPHTKREAIAPGDRLPNVPGLRLDGKPVSTIELLGSPGHTLLVLTGDRADPDAGKDALARLVRFDGLVRIIIINGPAGRSDPDAVTDPNLRAHRRYGALHGRLLLVRPDGYLACHAPLNRPNIPEQYLQQLTSCPPGSPNTATITASEPAPSRSTPSTPRAPIRA